MEDSSVTTDQQSKVIAEDEVTGSREEQDGKATAESDVNEVTSTVDTEENLVTSTSPNVDEEDGKKVESEDRSPEEKAFVLSSGQHAGKLTSRLAVWMKNHNVDKRVIDLIYWHDIKKTAVVFGILMLILLFLLYHTLISVISFFALSLLTVSVLYRLGMTVISAVQKTGNGNPYKSLLEKNFEIPSDKARDFGESLGNKVNIVVSKLKKLFLVEDVVSSLKFGIFLWLLSCVGKWFNAITLLIIGTVLLFTIPRLYEEYQTQVDAFLSKVSKKACEVVKTVKAKVESRLHKEKSA